MPEYQRTKADSLKPTVKKLLQEEKKEKEKEKEKLKKENDLNSDTASQSFLNKKEILLEKWIYHFLYKIILIPKNIYLNQILN